MDRRSRHLGALPLALFALGVACSPFGSSSSRPAKNTAAIAAALDRRVSIDYFQVPLADVLDFFTEDTGITASIDAAALAADDHAIDDCQVTLKLADVRWDSVLNLSARQCGLACVLDGNGPRMTTRDVAEQRLTAVVYPMPTLPLERGEALPEVRITKVLRVLLDDWSVPSGTSVEAVPGGLLVIHNADGHRQVAQLLAGMRKLAERPHTDAITHEVPAQSPAAAAVRRALARRVTIKVHDEPLQLFLDEIAERQELNIAVDWRSLHELGVSTDTPVCCDLADVPLDDALRRTLFPLGADAWISDEALWVAASDAESWTPTVEVHRLPAGLPGASSPDEDGWLLAHLHFPGCQKVFAPGGLAAVWNSRPDPALSRTLADLHSMFDPYVLPGDSAKPAADGTLNQMISVDWVDVPWRHALNDLAHQAGISQVCVDSRCDAAQHADRRTFTISLRNVLARRVLDVLLSPYDSQYRLGSGALYIADSDRFAVREARFHRLSHLPSVDGHEISVNLPDLIQRHIAADSWGPFGDGDGAIDLVPSGLVITQTQAVHEQVERFLDGLRKHPLGTSSEPPLDDPVSARLQRALTEPTTVVAHSRPLAPLLHELAAEHGIGDLLVHEPWNWESSDRGPPRITFEVRDVSLRSALNLLLESVDQRAVAIDGQLHIMPRAVAEGYLETRFYPLPCSGPREDDEQHGLAAFLTHVTSTPDPAVDLLVDFLRGQAPDSIHAVPGGLVVTLAPPRQAQMRQLLSEILPLLANGPTYSASPAIARLDAALAGPVSVDLEGLPLADALADLAASHDINIHLAADVTSMDRQNPVPPSAATYRGRLLADVLDELIGHFGLCWSMRDEVIYVTSSGFEQPFVYPRVFDIRQVWRPDGGLTMAELKSLVSETSDAVPPRHDDGPTPDVVIGGALLVSRDGRGHARIRRLLAVDAVAIARLRALAAPVDTRTFMALVAALDDPTPLLRRCTLQRLGCLLAPGDQIVDMTVRSSAIAAIARCLADSEADVRLDAVRCLGEIGPPAGASAEMLGLCLHDDSPVISLAAVRALGKLGPAAAAANEDLATVTGDFVLYAAVAQTLRGLREHAIPAWTQHLHARSALFTDACESLAKLGPRAADAVPAVIAAFDDPQGTYSRPLCAVLAAVGPAAEPAVPRLLSLVRLDPNARAAACQALGAIGSQPEQVVPALRCCLTDSDPDSRRAACSALARLGPSSTEAAVELRQLRDHDTVALVRDAAAAALIALGADADSGNHQHASDSKLTSDERLDAAREAAP